MVLPAYVRKGKASAAVGDFASLAVTGGATVGGMATVTGLLTATANLAIGGFEVQSAADALTAYAGGGQTNALQLAKGVNRISTVATAADSVKLPASVAGMVVFVINGAASNSMQVFGAGTDTINDVATATGVAQAAGKSAVYICPVAGKWYRVLSA
ncbi:hypothetical protein OSH11_11730 [Kaistia dalseonensis]|uniref:Uncharacterized protein n=1 Tax=Kaistia dalseonensis TaxID=410840 RepID=A0ABU0H7G3_9HYPH|nr:hypothetical protein [Kaistia dalseonensis]MCX5495380.1 hypothetical protein [Kaistia dalseonensis]MDQ0437967.1 hypothetical protein [Kaistia dalseonensis]